MEGADSAIFSIVTRLSEEKADNGMKLSVLKARYIYQQYYYKRFLQVFLRYFGFVCLLLVLPFMFSSGSQIALAASQTSTRPIPPRSSVQPLVTTSSHVDIVLVIDNVGEIKTYDPAGARFLAAQMFVNQAQLGSNIGVVKITSSNTAAALLNLTPIRNNNDKKTVRQVLKQSFFGAIDPGPVAYFVPAFQLASQMFLSMQANDHKYIVVMTDSQAQSGDSGSCASAPDQFHQWFCDIPTLQSENISVILFGFTTPTNLAMSQSIPQFLEQHGGTALQVG
jgi:hypothetical protein